MKKQPGDLGNLLVTGGLGFIGSHFIRQALGQCESLINVDYAGYGSNPGNLKDIRHDAKYRHARADINRVKPAARAKKIDAVINFAAETHVDRSIANPAEFVHSNVNGTLALLEFCRLHDVKRFVQISTDEVYGDATGQGHLDEDHPVKPSNPYSASKAAADLLVKSYNRTYGLDAVITRCSNNFGPNQFPEKLIPKTIIRSIKGLPVPIYGDGMQVREWIFVKDHVNAILEIIRRGRPGAVYNISSSTEIANIDLVNRISRILAKRGVAARIEHVPDRPGHDRRYSLDSTKISSETGWKPSYSLDSALEYTVHWYLDNEWWWKPLVTRSVLHPQPWTLNWKNKRTGSGRK
jgi:dTDP-glucose 4,6-dehydratase